MSKTFAIPTIYLSMYLSIYLVNLQPDRCNLHVAVARTRIARHTRAFHHEQSRTTAIRCPAFATVRCKLALCYVIIDDYNIYVILLCLVCFSVPTKLHLCYYSLCLVDLNTKTQSTRFGFYRLNSGTSLDLSTIAWSIAYSPCSRYDYFNAQLFFVWNSLISDNDGHGVCDARISIRSSSPLKSTAHLTPYTIRIRQLNTQ